VFWLIYLFVCSCNKRRDQEGWCWGGYLTRKHITWKTWREKSHLGDLGVEGRCY
jgi:hypothetical protein